MKRYDDSLMYPALEDLLAKIPQKYELVLTATRRAKQVIRELRLNPLAFSEEQRRRKPITTALIDIIEDRINREALMAPDLELDEPTEEPMDLFPSVEGLFRQPEDASADTEDAPDSDDDDTYEEDDDIDALFGSGVEEEEE